MATALHELPHSPVEVTQARLHTEFGGLFTKDPQPFVDFEALHSHETIINQVVFDAQKMTGRIDTPRGSFPIPTETDLSNVLVEAKEPSSEKLVDRKVRVWEVGIVGNEMIGIDILPHDVVDITTLRQPIMASAAD